MNERPKLSGIHHLKFSVSDLQRSLAFYERVFEARRIPQADHHRTDTGALYAYILEVHGLGAFLELRLDPEGARARPRFDPVTIAVPSLPVLEAWGHRLDALAIRRSPVLPSIQAWLLAFDDPDDIRIRLYTLAQHGPEIAPAEDDPWIVGD